MTNNSIVVEETKKTIEQLHVRKDAIIQETEAIVSELTLPAGHNVPPMGIDTPLTDAEGYPRNDIDILRARTLRSRLAVLRTDHTAVMKEMEECLQKIVAIEHPELAAAEQKELAERRKLKPKPKFDPVSGKWVVRNWDGTLAGGGSAATPRSFDTLREVNTPVVAATVQQTIYRANPQATGSPLAIVKSVAPHSPAAQAQLQECDLILAFGPIVTWKDEDISGLVRQAAASKAIIELSIRRGTAQSLLRLEPKPWAQQGLLGCHIVPHTG